MTDIPRLTLGKTKNTALCGAGFYGSGGEMETNTSLKVFPNGFAI